MIEKINKELRELIELHTNLDMSYTINNNIIVYMFIYVDKQDYKQIIVKDFNIKDNIKPIDIINHLKELSPFYLKN